MRKKRLLKWSVLLLVTLAFYVAYQFRVNPEAGKTAEQLVEVIRQVFLLKKDSSENQAAPDNGATETGGETQDFYELPQFSMEELPEYAGDGYVAVNGNRPYFETDYLVPMAFEYYSDLDALGRCGPAYACLGKELMPTEERGSISSVKPTGWKSTKYDGISGGNLYNRCHLIGFQLSGENANEKNLITGTRYMNVESMLLFENMVADYIRETGNHVLYRVWPVFEGKNLVASGVLMEGWSVEDKGAGICFNVYVYNAQPGIEIDYATGESRAE